MLNKIKKLINRLLGRNYEGAMFLDQNPKLKKYNIGKWSYGRLSVQEWVVSGTFTIGNYCSVAGVNVLLGGGHHQHWISSYSFPRLWKEHAGHMEYGTTRGDVTIGNDVWVGQNALILSGVTIGDGAVIGAGSVVRTDVPPYAIVVGNPSRVVGYRFEQEAIDEMLKICWWDWPEEKIQQALPDILTDDITEFIRKYRVSE